MPTPLLPDPTFFMGVDGGGTGCRVRLCDADGINIGAAEGGSANVYLDFDGAIRTIRSTIDAAIVSAQTTTPIPTDAVAVGLGLAGVSSPEIAARVQAALPGFARVVVSHDGLTACIGAHGGQDGGLVIAGTGSAAVLRRGAAVVSIGGRGFVLGDDGSGAQIGRAIWRRALRATDGLEPQTPLLSALMSEFDDDIVAVIEWARQAPSSAFAKVVPQVFEAAAAHDAAARAVIEDAALSIGELILTLQERGAPRIVLVGGLAKPLWPYLKPETAALLSPPLADAISGALLMAGGPAPIRKEPVV